MLAIGDYEGSASLVDAERAVVIARLPVADGASRPGTMRTAFDRSGRWLLTTSALPYGHSGAGGLWLYGNSRLWALDPPRDAPSGPILAAGFDSTGSVLLLQDSAGLRVLGPEGARANACVAGPTWSALAEGQRRNMPVQVLRGGTYANQAGVILTVPLPETGKPVLGPVALLPDAGSFLIVTGRASGPGTIDEASAIQCSTSTSLPLQEFALGTSTVAGFSPIALDRDGRRAAISVVGTGIGRSRAFVLDLHSGRASPPHDLPLEDVSAQAISPDGELLAVAIDRADLALLSLSTGAIQTQRADVVRSATQLAFDFSSRRLFVASMGLLRAFDLRGRSLGESSDAQVGVEFQPTSIAVTADGVVVVGEASGRISFWDAGTLSLLERTHAHPGAVLSLTVGRDMTSMVSVGADGARSWGTAIPVDQESATWLSRLALAGTATRPITNDEEEALRRKGPAPDWRTRSDLAAAKFWILFGQDAIQRAVPRSWWHWICWSGPYSASPSMQKWLKQNATHPLAASLGSLVARTDGLKEIAPSCW